MTPKEQFIQQGKLKQSKSRPHRFKLWRFMGEWIWGGDTWGTVTAGGLLHTDFIRLGRTENTEGHQFYALYLWRLAVIVAFV